MAVGKGRTRLLTINGRCFRWRCDFNEPLDKFSVAYAKHGNTWRPDNLVFRPEDAPHRLLTVAWPACEGPIVKPQLVRACIDEALRRGWLDAHSVMTLPGSEVPVPSTKTNRTKHST
jgi:hypothetical protein